jgi:16S rRNA (guanine527-N7)-methyltransferase
LLGYAPTVGLISARDAARVWERHILDSIRVVRCLVDEDRALVDMGSGAGLPGIPVAIVRPESTMLLVEPRRRRAAFLELVIERLGLPNASVFIGRSDTVPIRPDVVLARALAGPGRVWKLAAPLLDERGRILCFAGRTWSDGAGRAEVSEVSSGRAIVETCLPPELDWEGPIVIMRLAPASAEDRG